MADMTLKDMFYPYQWKFFSSKKKRKIWVSSRQLGKSWCLGGLLVYKALSKKNGLSLCISTGARAAAEIIKKCEMFAEAVKVMSDGQISYTSTFDQVKFSNGSRVMSLPSSTDGSNLRGYTAECVCIDEAAFIPHLDTILQAISPTLSRSATSELVFTTTPAGKNGYFYDLYQKALEDKKWLVQHTTIHEAIADGLQVDLESLHSLCPDPDVFAQEYECKFVNEYGSMIDTNLLVFDERTECTGRASFMGMDIGSQHDRTAIADVVQTGDDEYYVKDIVMMHKADYQHQLEVLKTLHKQRCWSSGYIDANGIGNPIGEFANKQVSARLKSFTWNANNKTKAYENLRALVFDRKIVFAEHLRELLVRDMQNVSRVVNEAGVVKYVAGRNENGHSDSVSALVLALMAAKEMPSNIRHPMAYTNQSAFGGWRTRLV